MTIDWCMKEDERFHWVGRLNNVYIVVISLFLLVTSALSHSEITHNLADFATDNPDWLSFSYYLLIVIGFKVMVIFAPSVLMLIAKYVFKVNFSPPYGNYWEKDSYHICSKILSWFVSPLGFAVFMAHVYPILKLFNYGEDNNAEIISSVESFQGVLSHCEIIAYGHYGLLAYLPLRWMLTRIIPLYHTPSS